MHKKKRCIRAFALLLAVSLLGACSNTIQLKPVTENYTSPPPNKGLIALRLGYKTIHPDNKFIDVPIRLIFMGADVNKENSLRKMLTTNSMIFNETSDPDYKMLDVVIETDAGDYSVFPASAGPFAVLKPHPSKFKVKHGYITYIGQYDIEATIKGKDFLSRSIRKRTSHTRDQESKNMEKIISDLATNYPNLKYEDVLKQPSPANDYRMRTLLSPNTAVYIHVYKQ